MALNKAARLLLKVLSMEDLDLKENYKSLRGLISLRGLSAQLARNDSQDLFFTVTEGEHTREIPARFFNGARTEEDDRIILFIHGGGWVTQSIDTYHHACLDISRRLGMKVLSVDYRLAPEHPFPCALEDCLHVLHFITLYPEKFGINPDRIILMGDSAGGNLAAACSMADRYIRDIRVWRQILLYPSVDARHTDTEAFPSLKENATDYLLTTEHVRDYVEMYASGPEDYENPYFAPLLDHSCANLPDTLILTAELDPLRDEGEAYARRLNSEGSYAECHRIPDAIHGFLFHPVPQEPVEHAYQYIDHFLKRVEDIETIPSDQPAPGLEPS